MRDATITVQVTVSAVPDHITDQQVLDVLSASVPTSLRWPERRSYVTSARLVEGPTEGSEMATEGLSTDGPTG